MESFVVVDRLRVDVILGTDTLKAYRAVIDLDENTATLKSTCEVFPLGSPRVEETCTSRISSTVRLRPGGQTLVITDVMGDFAEDATVLVESLPQLDATVKIARTLCTVQSGKLLVEVCSASTEDVVIRKGTMMAVATGVPYSAIGVESEDHAANASAAEDARSSAWIESVLGSAAKDASGSWESIPELKKMLREELNVDFSDSKPSEEHQRLMRELLEQFRVMLVENL